jgi:phosphopantothenoylcysteine decarboxylase/phosphopantothenate--cysteine ligase
VDDVTTALAGRRVVLGVSGGIAAYKAPLVARLFLHAGAEVETILTRGARHFVGSATFEGLTSNPARTEVWEEIERETHVALARSADVVAVYPATAHLMAKAAGGLADDLLTTTLLAATCPVVMAPAMHAEMWQHPATQQNLATLSARGMVFVGPVDGALMGGDSGPGRAVEPEVFVAAVAHTIARDLDLRGRTVVVTAGGTREAIDPVRFLGNRSTGKMGFAIAAAAAARGATVQLVAAPTPLSTPPGVSRHDVVSTRDMHESVMGLAGTADVVIKAAAVADFRPTTTATSKIKKAGGPPTIELTANPDILADLGTRRREDGTGPAVLVGFAAETDDVEENGRAKLERKGCDLLVVNDVSRSDAGFAVDTNQVVILGADGARVDLPLASKREVANRVLDEVVKRLP